MRSTEITLCALAFAAACGGAPEGGSPNASRGEAAVPGEEPLATERLGDEEVVPLEPLESETRAPVAAERPCPWARAWQTPGAARPHAAGIGGVPTPAKVADAPVSIPSREPAPEGEIVVEIVIGPGGEVAEAEIVRSTDPPWPEAETRILEAVKKWRYEPPLFQGTGIAVCTTLVVRP